MFQSYTQIKKKKKKSRIATESKIENFKPPPNQYNKKSPKTQKFRLVLLCPLCWTICFFTPVLDIVNCYFIVASFYFFFILSLSLSLSLSNLSLYPSSLSLFDLAPSTSHLSIIFVATPWWLVHGGLWVLLKDFGFFVFRFFVGCLDLEFFLFICVDCWF